MTDGNSFRFQRDAKSHILVSVMAITLVKGNLQHQVALNQKISSMEIMIGSEVTLLYAMLVFLSMFVTRTQIVFRSTSYYDASINDRRIAGKVFR